MIQTQSGAQLFGSYPFPFLTPGDIFFFSINVPLLVTQRNWQRTGRKQKSLPVPPGRSCSGPRICPLLSRLLPHTILLPWPLVLNNSQALVLDSLPAEWLVCKMTFICHHWSGCLIILSFSQPCLRKAL